MYRLSVHRHLGDALCRQCCNKRIGNRVVYPRIFLRRYPIFCRNVEVIPQQRPGVWGPFEPLRSNIELIPEKKSSPLLFRREIYIKGGPRSFSYGVHTQTAKNWEATFLYYLRSCINSIVLVKSTETTLPPTQLQDRIMTPSARRVLAGSGGGGDIGANKGHLHFLNGEAMIKSVRTELKVNGNSILNSC